MIRRSCLRADVDFILVRFKLPAACEGVDGWRLFCNLRCKTEHRDNHAVKSWKPSVQRFTEHPAYILASTFHTQKKKNNSPRSSWLLAEHREKAGICCAAELGSLGLTLLRNLLPPWDLGLSSNYGCLEGFEVLSEIFMLRGDRNKTWSLAWTSSTISEASRFPSAALARAVGSIYI